MRVETVVIDTANGPVIINKSDFDVEKHTLHGAKKVAVKNAAVKKAAVKKVVE